MKIVDDVFIVPAVVANPYIIVDAGGLTVVDTGLPRSQKKILAYVMSLGKSERDVKRIILTQWDLDHVGGLAVLHRATGARTYASKIEAEAMAVGKSSRQIRRLGFSLQRLMFAVLCPFMRAKPFQVDEIVKDDQVMAVGGGLPAIETIGRTPGHISLFLRSSEVLFCGDSLVTDADGIHGSRSGLTWDYAKAREAVKKQAALGVRIVCPGHGPVVMDAAGKFPD